MRNVDTTKVGPSDADNQPTEKHTEPVASRLPYLAGIDGLRAIAVVAVYFYHAQFAWMAGGFLGVEVFFVISGYLITGLLLAEWRKTNGLNLGRFWFRRARRLLPAVFTLILATLVFAVLFLPGEVASLRSDALAAAAYVSNWYQILSHKSYFEAIGRPSLLRHLWSLAVEEQFYVVWPLLLLAGLRWLRPRGRFILPVAVLVLAVASTLLMAGYYQPDADPSRIYYGTDTRAAGFLIGAALAMLLVPRTGDVEVSRRRSLAIDMAGVSALLTLIAIFVLVNEINPYLYLGGFAVVAVLSAIVIVAVVYPRTCIMPGLLGTRVLTWLGLRSYSIYLWHWPVIDLTRPYVDVPFGGLPLYLLQAALTLVLAELSYRFIERPVRDGALGRLWQSLWRTRRVADAVPWAAGSVVSLAICVAVGISVVNARPPDVPSELAEPTATVAAAPTPVQVAAIATPVEASPTTPATASPTNAPVSTVTPVMPAKPYQIPWPYSLLATNTISVGVVTTPALRGTPFATALAATPAATSTKAVAAPAATARITSPVTPVPGPTLAPQKTVTDVLGGNYKVLAIGDSVMLGAAHELAQSLGGAEVNAEVSRQASAAIALLQSRKDAGTLGDVVIIHIGSNGFVTQKQFDQMMQILKGVPIVAVVNVRVPLRWESANNTLFANSIKNVPNAVLVDWYGLSNQHPDWFTPDGVHLQPEARQKYADLIVAQIKAFNSSVPHLPAPRQAQ